jgi:hypothetical protein
MSWLSHGGVFYRVSAPKGEMDFFLCDSNNRYDADLFYSEDYVQEVACLVDIL